MSTILDAHGHAFSLGASAHVYKWRPTVPLGIPYLWTVVEQNGNWYVQPRPTGDLQPLTAAFGRTLCLFQEPDFARPEANAVIWHRLLKLGWVIHAEQVGNKLEYLFQARCAIPAQDQRNATLSLVVTAASLNRRGTTTESQAELLWKHLLNEISKRANSDSVVEKRIIASVVSTSSQLSTNS
jgi:hypothetical protein